MPRFRQRHSGGSSQDSSVPETGLRARSSLRVHASVSGANMVLTAKSGYWPRHCWQAVPIKETTLRGKDMMKKLLVEFDQLVERLDDYEAKNDAMAWMRREMFDSLSRGRSILEAIASTEEE